MIRPVVRTIEDALGNASFCEFNLIAGLKPGPKDRCPIAGGDIHQSTYAHLTHIFNDAGQIVKWHFAETE
jgi:hypothetical protein